MFKVLLNIYDVEGKKSATVKDSVLNEGLQEERSAFMPTQDKLLTNE